MFIHSVQEVLTFALIQRNLCANPRLNSLIFVLGYASRRSDSFPQADARAGLAWSLRCGETGSSSTCDCDWDSSQSQRHLDSEMRCICKNTCIIMRVSQFSYQDQPSNPEHTGNFELLCSPS